MLFVELRHHEAGDARDAAENLDLRHGILSDRGIEYEQHRMRRRGIDFFHDTNDFFKFRHEFGAVLQAACRIHQQHIGVLVLRCLDRVEGQSAASLPCSRAMTMQPNLSPQMRNCSMAAARNVSPAASITFLPSG